MYAGVPGPAGSARAEQQCGNTHMTKRRALRAGVLTAGLGLVLAGCQAIGNEEAQSTEQVLAAAGFHMKEATTPQQLANLKAMTQRKIVIQDQNGEARYVYADAEGCKC